MTGVVLADDTLEADAFDVTKKSQDQTKESEKRSITINELDIGLEWLDNQQTGYVIFDRTKGQGLVVPSWAPQIEALAHGWTGGAEDECNILNRRSMATVSSLFTVVV
ncbi:hypothetical protein LguiA_017746 [Lonicera macranthoides]